MFAAVYSWRAMGPAVLDPEVGIDFSRLVHGAQEFTWRSRWSRATRSPPRPPSISQAGDINVFTFNSRSINQRGELVCEGTWTNFVR